MTDTINPSPYPLVDIGANLGHDSFSADLDEVLSRAKQAGLIQLIVTGTSPSASEHAIEIALKHPEFLRATAGVHPHEAQHCHAPEFEQICALAKQEIVCAVGETGLDFNRDFSPRPAQESVFEKHLELACEIHKPVFLHQREAHERFLPILKNYRDALTRGGVVHCFTGEKHELFDYLDLDMYIGITGWICDERRGAHLLEFVKNIPSNRLLIETDAPYLLPRSLRPKPKSRRNEPSFLPEVLKVLAQAVDRSPAQLAEQTTANAQTLFQLAIAP